MNRPCALYRLFDASGSLLYIGITTQPETRWKGHASDKPWWNDVVRKELEWYDSVSAADAAETAAIQSEHSRYNVAKSPWAPKPRVLNENEEMAGRVGKKLGSAIMRVAMSRKALYLMDMSRARKPVAALVPSELAAAAFAAGGMDVATEILKRAASGS